MLLSQRCLLRRHTYYGLDAIFFFDKHLWAYFAVAMIFIGLLLRFSLAHSVGPRSSPPHTSSLLHFSEKCLLSKFTILTKALHSIKSHYFAAEDATGSQP